MDKKELAYVLINGVPVWSWISSFGLGRVCFADKWIYSRLDRNREMKDIKGPERFSGSNHFLRSGLGGFRSVPFFKILNRGTAKDTEHKQV